MKRMLVCGGRNYADLERMTVFMREGAKRLGVTGPDDLLVIHGKARGADTLAGIVARASGVAVHEFPADWTKHGKRAGYVRNQQMLDEGKPDLVVAAPGGRGTDMMVEIAQKAGVAVLDFREDIFS